MEDHQSLSWFGIARLGLVQAALGAIVVLTTSTLNRVMVIELALPAMVPGVLVGIHYAMQVFRPRLGYGSDLGGRRTPWIFGGMVVLATGGALAAVGTALMATRFVAGSTLAVLAFVLIGLGVGAAGTSLLVLLAKRTSPARRSAAASIAWIMMIAGFIVTTAIAGHALDPFSADRLVTVSAAVSGIALVLTLAGLWGVEGDVAPGTARPARTSPGFRREFIAIWNEPRSRRFAVFIFVSMLAYSAQDLILEPFAGSVFHLTPGETTRLSSVQHVGALVGMVLMPVLSGLPALRRLSTTNWIIGGCLASALALANLAVGATIGEAWPLRASVLLLGMTNGVYAIAAIGAMMTLVGADGESREGTRMGLWGASQAISFGIGGFLGTVASDMAHHLVSSGPLAYALVFIVEACLFLVAARLAAVMGASSALVHPASAAAVPVNQGA